MGGKLWHIVVGVAIILGLSLVFSYLVHGDRLVEKKVSEDVFYTLFNDKWDNKSPPFHLVCGRHSGICKIIKNSSQSHAGETSQTSDK